MEHGKREPASEKTPRRREPREHQSTKKGTGRKVGFIIGTLVLIGLCTSAMLVGIFMMYVKTTLAPTLKINADDYTMNQSSVIYYHDDTVTENDGWVELQTIHGEENRILVDFDQMPDALWQAAVAIEDERFFEHHGVDWKRTLGATLNMFIGMKDTFGGSTITQQLLKNMTGDDDPYVNRKVREIFRALEFEKNYTKQEILELYLNTIFLGKGCYGVQTAAEYYFGKDVSELSVAECASLIAITNNPSMYGPMYNITITRDDGTTTPRELNKERQERILDKMTEVVDPETGEPFLTEEEAEAAKAEVLQFTDGTTSATELVAQATGGIVINSWFVDQVIRDVTADLATTLGISEKEASIKLYNSGYQIYTTLDPNIQEIAESVYEDRSNLDVTSRSGQKLQSGITIIEPSTGNIVAMVGAVGEKDRNLGWNYATGKRQVGSSIKPLTVYAPALDAGVITMASTFDNYPVRLLNGSPWPKNSPQGYSGWTTLSSGVANSINTVAVQVVEKLGVANSYAFATENLNLSLVPEDMAVSPLGLGGLTNGLSTVEMAAAYASFANDGVYNEPRTYVRVTDTSGNVIIENESESHVAMKDTTAYFMNQLLQGVINSGTGGSARFSGMTIAGKTGTTSDNYDRYFVGYTPYYCAAVWTGYDQPEKISYSGNPAITMWKKVMQQIHANLENKSFNKPTANFVTVQVCADSGMLATDACAADVRGDSRVRSVTVLAGTAPTEECTMHVMRDYCTEGNCLASEFCPEESIVQKSFLDYTRTDYGPSIVADDNAYLLSTWEAKEPCTVHNAETVVPENPDNPDEGGSILDPDNPNFDPSGGFGDENMNPEEGSSGNTEQQPPETDSSGGDDDWWVLIN